MEKEKFIRNCPQCNFEIIYTNKKNRNTSEKNKLLCKKCVFENKKENNRFLIEKYLTDNEFINSEIEKIFNLDKNKKRFISNVYAYLQTKEVKKILSERICPSCKEKIIHANLYNRKSSEGKKCKKCYHEEFGKKKKECSGEKNYFFGKTHKKETINKIIKSKETSEAWKNHLEYKKSDEGREKASIQNRGEKNPRFGLGSLKDIWIRKLGQDEGLKRWDEWRKMQSGLNSGEKNNMFGKPSPVGSGNGWSGWLNVLDKATNKNISWYFRSLLELSYMIDEIELKEKSWENGEQNKYRISYVDWNGVSRNYFPDFVVEKKFMIECKPVSLHNSETVILKKIAADKFCTDNNLEYLLIEPPTISDEKIIELYKTKRIKFLPRYEEKFLKKYFK